MVISKHSLTVLRTLWAGPVPRNTVNPGVSGMLIRKGLVESVQLVSPYVTHRGRKIEHLRITDAGVKIVT